MSLSMPRAGEASNFETKIEAPESTQEHEDSESPYISEEGRSMHSQHRVYLDANSTSPLLPQVREAMIHALGQVGNPSSPHRLGRETKSIMEHTRERLAVTLEAHPDHIIFTSGGTEANNQALRSVPWQNVLISALEHESVQKASENPYILPTHPSGLLDLEALERALRTCEGLTLVSVLLASNETGVIQPIQEISRLVHQHGAFLHTDATQAFGRLPLSFHDLDVDLMTISAHKAGGPLGLGALVAKATVPLSAFVRGGGQEKNRRSGTENIVAITGLRALLDHMPDLSHLRPWHIHLEQELKAFGNAFIFSEDALRLPNTTCIALPGVPHHVQMMFFDLNHIAVGVGSACSSGRITHSRILAQFPNVGAFAPYAIRVSSGWHTQQDDLRRFIHLWKALATKHHPSDLRSVS